MQFLVNNQIKAHKNTSRNLKTVTFDLALPCIFGGLKIS